MSGGGKSCAFRLSLCIAFWSALAALFAQTPPPPSELVNEIRLPLDRIATEQLTDRVPIPLDEYQSLRKKAEETRETPSATRLLKADYTATYGEHRLTSGHFNWTIQNTSGNALTRPMEPLGLAVLELQWGDRPAIWGTSPAGSLEVLVDRQQGELQGRWELTGKSIGEHDEFVLQIPSATVSQLTLQVPVGRIVTAVGHTLSSAPGIEGHTAWTILLGGRTECRIVILQLPAAAASSPLILVQNESLYALRQEGLRFRTELRLEVTNSAVREIPIWVDPDLEIFSITYGNEIPLPWQVTSVDGRQRLLVKLPDDLLGTGRALKLRGVAPLKTDVEWKLPNVAVAGAALVDGQAVLQLAPPLQLQQLTTSGYRQIGVETNASREDLLTFKQFRTDGILSVKLGKPRPRIRARVLSDLQTQSPEWSCSTQLQLTGAEGAAFVVECRIPAGWDVTDVRDPQSPQLDWSIVTTADGQRLLSLQFLEALAADKTRLIEIDARRNATGGDQTFAVPAFEPLQPHQSSAEPRLGVDDLQMLIAVNSSTDVQPVLESGTSFEQCETADIDTEWKSNKFWKTPLTERIPQQLLLLRLNGAVPEGHFSLQSVQTPIEVVAEMKVDVTADKLTKTVNLQVTPRHGKTERVLVYLSELGPQLTWTLEGPNPRPIVARKLQNFLNAVWEVPRSGELWELLLPQPQSEPFELKGVRIRGVTPTGRLGLAFVPQAQAFRGRITVQTPSDMEVELTGWQTDSDGVTSLNGPLKEHVWTWHSAKASVRFQTRVAAELPPEAVVRRIAIQARWPLEPGAHDYYIARLELGSGFKGHPLNCTLPADAEVTEVKVDGQSIPFAIPAPGAPLVLNNVTDEQLVVIAYRARSPGLLRPVWRTLLLPKLGIPVLRCDVELLTPSEFRLGSEPRGMVLKSSTPSISTLQRLFGPLGRSTQEVFFNPLFPLSWAQSWNRHSAPMSLGEQSPDSSSVVDNEEHDDVNSDNATPSADDPGRGPASASLQHAGWKVWRGSAAMLPEQIDLWLWSNRQATGTAWLGFWGCLLAGTTFRILRLSPRGGLGSTALVIEILLAIVLPPLPAQIVGGCLAGTLLALLWPQRLINRAAPVAEANSARVPQGSTRSYAPSGSGVTLTLVFGLGLAGSLAFAQPPSPAGTSSTSQLPQVLIPVDANNRPLGSAPLAYVPERLLKDWTALRSRQGSSADWLIQSGEYVMRRDTHQRLDLAVRFDITVLSLANEVEVTIPLQGVNFGGPNACLVDGQPHPILTRPDSNTLIVRLPGAPALGPPPPPMPESTERPTELVPLAPYAVAARTYQIEFQGFPIVQTAGNRQQMEFTVPPLHAARWTFKNDHPDLAWTNRIGDINCQIAPQQAWTRELGPVKKIGIESSATPLVTDPAFDARLVLLADAQPAVAQLHYQANYRVTQGQVSNVIWQLPPGLAVRDVSGPLVFDWRLIPSPAGVSLLHIDLQRPVTDNFVVKVEALLPNDGPPSQLTILPVQLLNPKNVQLRPTSSLVGIRTSSEFQPEAPAEAGEQIAPSTIDEFVNEWGKTSIGLKPQAAYSLLDPVPLKIGLRALHAQRVVRMTAVGVLGSRHLQWNLNATIEVQTAAAYSHQLEIDPRLNVISVGIQEDAANRLLRWTRTGNILHVFLQDKTTGTQTLTLQGTMPTQVPQELALPIIKFANATIADARLQLYQEPDLEVEVADLEKWEQLEVPSELRLGAARNLLVGRFKWSPDVGPFVVSMKQNDPVLTYSAVTTLQPREGHWKLTTNFLFEVKQGHGSQFSIRVPPEVPPPVRIGDADVRQVFEREADGSQRILLYPRVPVRDKFVVQVWGDINIAPGSAAVIPEMQGLNASCIEHFIVLPTDAQFAVDPRSSGLNSEPLPAELANLLPAELQGTTGHPYRGTAGAWTVTLARPREEVPRTGVLWSETQIWCGPTDSISGKTSMLIGPQESELVDLTVPIGVELQGVLLDGEFIPHASPESHRLLIPLTFPQAGHVLTVYWTQGTAAFGMLYNRADFFWPRIAGQDVVAQYLTVTPPPGFRMHTTQGQSVERLTVQLSELQALLQLMRQRAGDGPAPQDAQWQFLHRQSSSLLKRLRLEPRLHIGGGGLHERFSAMEAQFLPWEQLTVPSESPDPRETHSTSYVNAADSLEGNLAGPHSLLLMLSRDAATNRLSATIVGESVWRWMLGLGASALGLCVVWLLRHWQFRDWLTEDPAFAWALLGLVWWFCLTPSWLGIVWLVISAFYFVRLVSRLRIWSPADTNEEFDPAAAAVS